MNVDGDQQARLYRSRVYYRDELNHADSEEIGYGSLAKMLRAALSDPDDEVWRYSIRSATLTVEGDELRTCEVVQR